MQQEPIRYILWRKDEKMKKILYTVILTTIIFVLSSCSFDVKKEDNIKNYGAFWEYDGSISEYLIFPKEIPESATEVTYKCIWNDASLIDPTIQIYLEYQLDEEEYVAEVQRISSIQLEEGIHPVWLDEDSFEYPAYVATDGYAYEYEYVLMDEKNYRLIYVYLWHELLPNIKFDKDYLPDYFGKDEMSEEKRSIYWIK